MRIWIAAAMAGALPACLAVPASAQMLDSLKGAMGSAQGGGGGMGGALGGMSMPSVGSASSSNIAGVLGYCVRNKYENGNGAAAVASGLTGKLGASGTGDSQYQSGNQGMLQTGNGQNYSLGGGGLKGKITQKVCDQVLKHAKSLI